MAVTGLTMFRARDGDWDLDELIPDRTQPGALEFEDFRLTDGSIALVHYTSTPLRSPRWARFFAGIIDPAELRSASASAVIAFQREGHWYLVTFGYARYLLNQDLMEPRFGLRATLNGIDPDKIRSIDRKRVDTVSRLTREQVSRDSRMAMFGLDVQRDLLRAVTGVPTEDRLGRRLYGKDAVGVRLDVRPAELGEVADLLEALYQDDRYRDDFPWVDHISEVQGSERLDPLDALLVERLRKEAAQEFELAPPEILDWEVADRFVFGRLEDQPQGELRLQTYHELVREAQAVSVEDLHSDKVRLFDQDGNRLATWSIYRCLTGEVMLDGDTYVISDGRWYRIDRDFADEIDRFVDDLIRPTVELPPYTDEVENEAEYLAHVVGDGDGEYALMDQNFIYPRTWQDRIELCDLYRADGVMVHVKRYSGGSATLSHLFAQGSVAVRCLLTDRVFRVDANRALPDGFELDEDEFAADSCRVVYAIVAQPGRELRLPFFSRVALRNAAESIQQMGARVSLQAIVNHSEA